MFWIIVGIAFIYVGLFSIFNVSSKCSRWEEQQELINGDWTEKKK